MNLSKSKLVSGRQCPRRLWLEVHRPDLLEADSGTEQLFAFGHRLNEVARSLEPDGTLIGHGDDPGRALVETRAALAQPGDRTLFEPAFVHEGILVRADILRRRKGRHALVELKASTEPKPHHAFDCAVQAYVIEGSGLQLGEIALAHVNSEFVYPGGGDYRGLLCSTDIGTEARAAVSQVPKLAASLRKVLAGKEPNVRPGPHCEDPYPCPFIEHCEPGDYPVRILPRSAALIERLRAESYRDLRDVPGEAIRSRAAHRVWQATRTGSVLLDPELRATLRSLGYPRHYLDFETIRFVVPIWKGTRPYEQLPFQWSLHIEHRNGRLAHREFLDTSGEPPMEKAAAALLEAVGAEGPVVTYGPFERTVLRALAERYPRLAAPLEQLAARIVDVLPLLRAHYHHPAMKGSWSLKAVLPAVAPELGYAGLGEVADGEAAERAYLEILDPATDAARKAKLAADLRAYCARDTFGLRLLVQKLSG
ncbi:MAG: DUF2779 domain-containing protein [Burkholderiales bacterium]|nr:DUF2779 domain-containing protein [Burkholderiales bacterium]